MVSFTYLYVLISSKVKMIISNRKAEEASFSRLADYPPIMFVCPPFNGAKRGVILWHD